MNDFVIVTDSCCDMPRSYMDEKQIPFVSLTCNFLGNEYKDDFGVSLSYNSFYEGMKSGEIPKTSQPNADAFYAVFEKIVKEGKSILYVGVSSGLSGTYNSANIAKNMILDAYPNANVELVDTLTASLGQGLMLIKAIEMQNNGSNLYEIKSFIEDNRLRLNTYITVDDLNHLKRGGRISTTAAILGTVLHIKPILTLNDEGRVIAIHKAKGRKSAISKLAEFVCKKIEKPEEEIVCICHGDIEKDALKLKEAILSEVKVRDILINPIGPVVGTYGGPGALAVFFLGKHRQNHLIDVNLK